jgi:hypothetical protein
VGSNMMQEPKSTSLTYLTDGRSAPRKNQKGRKSKRTRQSAEMTQFSSFRSRCKIPMAAKSATVPTICPKINLATFSEKLRCFSTHSNRSEEERRIIGASGGEGGSAMGSVQEEVEPDGVRGKSEKAAGGVMGGEGRWEGT